MSPTAAVATGSALLGMQGRTEAPAAPMVLWSASMAVCLLEAPLISCAAVCVCVTSGAYDFSWCVCARLVCDALTAGSLPVLL